MKYVFAGAILTLLTGQSVGDGPKDNLPEHVRPIPRPGINVPAGKRVELKGGLAELQGLIQQPEQSDTPLVHDLLPDVQVFYRAVYDALDVFGFHPSQSLRGDNWLGWKRASADAVVVAKSHDSVGASRASPTVIKKCG